MKYNNKLTQEELKRQLHYNPETGIFTRLVSNNSRFKIGQVVGTKHHKGYLHTKINNENYSMHRLAWLYVYGKYPINNIDHIDGNPSNNRITNLRDVLQKDNAKNNKLSKNNKSGYNGVHYHKTNKKWIAYIASDSKFYNIGSYDSKYEAYDARLKYELELFGEFSRNHLI